VLLPLLLLLSQHPLCQCGRKLLDPCGLDLLQ